MAWLFIGNPSQSYKASPAIWSHTMLPATEHRWTRPVIASARQAGTRFTYPGGMEGWVDLFVAYTPRWFACMQYVQTVTHPGSKHLIETRQGVEPRTSRSQMQRPNRIHKASAYAVGEVAVLSWRNNRRRRRLSTRLQPVRQWWRRSWSGTMSTLYDEHKGRTSAVPRPVTSMSA